MRSLARLLLVGSGDAGPVEDFQLGPLRNGSRQVALTYWEPQVYSNVAPHCGAFPASGAGARYSDRGKHVLGGDVEVEAHRLDELDRRPAGANGVGSTAVGNRLRASPSYRDHAYDLLIGDTAALLERRRAAAELHSVADISEIVVEVARA